ncbi:hypothetical protein QYM36_017328 [Artemia franciscana]|uniref:Uncharacterized protein n=1 Tax=Artemia franciscana TaxID=6661 RepID=A0AA88H7T5_ARTSF|nr:hypothetical protein QYM36_017328 [Artemia franciscana]
MGNSNSGEESHLYLYAVNRIDNFEVDTDAQANLFCQYYLDMLSPKPTLQTTSHRLTSYCGSQIPSLGTCKLQCRYKNGQSKPQLFYVFTSRTKPITELKSSQELNLAKLTLNIEAPIQTDQLTSTPKGYEDVFKGAGMLSEDYQIYLKDNATPTVHRARKVPITMRNKLKNELVHLEKLSIIEKVIKSTEWVNAIVMVDKKDGSICLCN